MQGQSQAIPIAGAFAKLAGMAATAANENRRAIADANIAADTQVANLALREQRSKLAQAFSKHSGTLAVNAAFRGSSAGDPSVQAAILSAGLRAGNEAAVAEANRAAQIASSEARNAFVETDVRLAALEGGIRGLNFGLDIAGALQAAGEQQRRSRVEIIDTGSASTFGFSNVIEDVLLIPGLDFGNLDFSNFGIDLGFGE